MAQALCLVKWTFKSSKDFAIHLLLPNGQAKKLLFKEAEIKDHNEHFLPS
jgi:hypothetical protein